MTCRNLILVQLVMCMTVSIARAQTVTITGRVFDLKGMPIAPDNPEALDPVRVLATDDFGNSVAVNEQGESIDFVLSDNGTFSIRVQSAAIFNLSFERDGFTTRTLTGLISRPNRPEMVLDVTVPRAQCRTICRCGLLHRRCYQVVTLGTGQGLNLTKQLEEGDLVTAVGPALLRIGSRTTGRVVTNENLEVLDVNKGWVRVRQTKSGEAAEGWVPRHSISFVAKQDSIYSKQAEATRSKQDAFAYRVWTNQQGKNSEPARFIRVSQDNVYFEAKDGRLLSVSTSQLSDSDRDFVFEASKNVLLVTN